ncbi:MULTISPECIES: HAD domain-containing protein [Achromobacter]|uniref:HAD domain-containing protein n=1 Tax=Achromobacter spanius TaxID=217203 RepID=A0ABY8GRV8_9BURK|nr:MULTISPECIES: HAD domain-containing protein [Achromobacter]WAI83239.1 HAD domain-containing protein [Achromobacter spanius]WEX93325.1 HAD domain-containing protein [Achromobacter sp. SS2-2022]WFP07517.1 HAD domain-containing protein [Achromobacter spanius]
MKVLFLDIDGVLNSFRSAVAFGGYPWPKDKNMEGDWEKFDQVAVKLMARLVAETEAHVVLSSTWRIGMDQERITELASFLGYAISSATPQLPGCRGLEIERWLTEHPGVEKYVIIDDDSDMLPEQMANFIKVDGTIGLTYQNYKDAKQLLA